MDARGAGALAAGVEVLAAHAVHVGRRASQIAQRTFEIRHLRHLTHFAQDALAAARGNEFALMGRDGAEGASAEAAPVERHRMAYHVVGGNALAPVFGMGQTRVGQIERGVDLLRRHRGIGRIDHHIVLHQHGSLHAVALFLHVAEVLGVLAGLAQTFLVGMQHDDAFALGALSLAGEIDRLGHIEAGLAESLRRAIGFARLVVAERLVVFLQSRRKSADNLAGGLLAHAVGDGVGAGGDEDGGHDAVLPVVVVGHTAQ